MNKGRFLNQKLGKRASRRIALLKSQLPKNRIQESGFRNQDQKRDSGFGIQGKPGKVSQKQDSGVST